MWLCEKAPCALYDWLAIASNTPSQLQVASHGLSFTPGSVNVPLNVAGTKTSGPARPVLVPLKAVIVGGTFPTVTFDAPSEAVSSAGAVTVGATFLTVTDVVYSVAPSSLSMIRPRTV